MIAIVAPAPGPLLEPLRALCKAPTELWTPLAAPAWLQRMPGPIGEFARRRGTGDRAAPALLGIDATLRAWAGTQTDRRYLAEFARRVAIDHWAAREVERTRPRVVIAGSLAARRTFAAARSVGATCVLVLDVPLLRALHRDLDRAAAVWPSRSFLRRFRAPSWAIARQEAERVLADLILVRGAYARSLCLADGIPEARLAMLPAPPPPVITPGTRTRRIRLAGLAAARHGIDTAVAAARAVGATLVVRIGEGTEPANLAMLPGIATDAAPVDAIICPAVCETYPPELRAIGIPIIASPMASVDGRGPDPFDASAFAAAITGAHAATASPPSLARLLAVLE